MHDNWISSQSVVLGLDSHGVNKIIIRLYYILSRQINQIQMKIYNGKSLRDDLGSPQRPALNNDATEMGKIRKP